jgi:hypothetical protein
VRGKAAKLNRKVIKAINIPEEERKKQGRELKKYWNTLSHVEKGKISAIQRELFNAKI